MIHSTSIYQEHDKYTGFYSLCIHLKLKYNILINTIQNSLGIIKHLIHF